MQNYSTMPGRTPSTNGIDSRVSVKAGAQGGGMANTEDLPTNKPAGSLPASIKGFGGGAKPMGSEFDDKGDATNKGGGSGKDPVRGFTGSGTIAGKV